MGGACVVVLYHLLFRCRWDTHHCPPHATPGGVVFGEQLTTPGLAVTVGVTWDIHLTRR